MLFWLDKTLAKKGVLPARNLKTSNNKKGESTTIGLMAKKRIGYFGQNSLPELLAKALKRLRQWLWLLVFRGSFRRIGRNVSVEPGVHIDSAKRVSLGNNVAIETLSSLTTVKTVEREGSISIGDNSKILRACLLDAVTGSIDIGSNCSLNPYCVILGRGNVKIGNNTRIGPGVTITSSNHGRKKNALIRQQAFEEKAVEIGEDCWLGAGATILPGVSVGKGAIVGAGAVVTKNVPVYTIVAGNPAKEIKKRA